MLAAICKPLDTSIECLLENVLYKADDELYLLGNISPDELKKYQELKVNLDGWGNFDLENYLNLGVSENLTIIY